MADDYCEMCDLPFSTCVHGRPPPPEPARHAPAPRTSRTPSTRTSTAKTSATKAPRPSRRTAQDAFRTPILATLVEHGGTLPADEVLEALGARLDDTLLSRDREASPTGELRWQTSARAERKAMIDEGLIVPAQPGVWELTDLGRKAALTAL